MKRITILSISMLLAFLTSCAAFFQPRVPIDFDSSNAGLDDLLVEETKGGKLKTPSQILASKNKDSSSISLRWSAVDNAVAYRIEYAVVSPDSNGIYPEKIGDEQFNVLENSWYDVNYKHNITKTTIDDYENRYEKRYFYRVTAINIREGYDDSDPTPSDVYGTLFAPPRNVKASAGESTEHIIVSWDFVKGADKYQIFRSENEKGAGAGFMGTVEGNLNRFKDEGIGPKDKGKEFYYIVYAVNKDGKMSEQSSIAMGYSLVPGAPAKPGNVTITNGRGNSPDAIILKWNKVQSEKTISYNVFRYSSKDSSLTKVGRDLTGTEFADRKNLEPGIYYNYVVQAVAKDMSTGESLKSPMSIPVEGYILSPPENIRARKYNGGVKLSWEKAIGSPDEQATYTYKILGCNSQDGVYNELKTIPETELVVDSYAFYKINTVKNGNIVSQDSKIAAPAPDAAISVKVSRADYSFLGDNPVANDVGVYPAKITWAKPEKDEPAGYYVYRSLKEDSGYRKITNNVVTDLFYLDNDASLQAGKVYYYKVLSLNSLSQGENFSNYDYGWGALTHESYLKEFNETIISSQKKLTLMHKPGSTDKLGSETKNGTISGNVYYNAAVQGLGAYITMKYTDYADIYINPADPSMGVKFTLNGNSDTSANMSSNGTMNGTITCKGMYPGKVNYNKIEIKAGAAGGGAYGVTPDGFTSKDVIYSVLEE